MSVLLRAFVALLALAAVMAALANALAPYLASIMQGFDALQKIIGG